ncbi:hypothetical protein HELRODRAFT_167113 [Helobdella robusta]|uniref:Glutaredoxin domain-containing protein n=1 Tax=Helobdella robusta TaxID=6412 RepID=T1EZ13_HELRO|nr:hypothetical protein HELRODRAFT_167113 [Helobdella robusta]ESO10607.1 hypothetical protein HELRODRAFT_167113 [Helobdella robusta]
MGILGSKETTQGDFISKTIAKNCVVLFIKDSCPFSQDALEIFNKLKIPFCSVSLNQMEDMDKMQQKLGDMTGARTVPRVFINGKSIGGADETLELAQSGKLLEMVKECAPELLKSACKPDFGVKKRN